MNWTSNDALSSELWLLTSRSTKKHLGLYDRLHLRTWSRSVSLVLRKGTSATNYLTYESLFDSIFDTYETYPPVNIRIFRQACVGLEYLLLSTCTSLFDRPKALHQCLDTLREQNATRVSIIITRRFDETGIAH